MKDVAVAISPARISAPEEDAALMRAVAAGDQAAFRRLMQRHLAGTVRLATRVLGGNAEAEDVAQDAFIRVWRHAQSFEDPKIPDLGRNLCGMGLQCDNAHCQSPASD